MNEEYIKSQFVDYEIALAVKELGFDEECLGWYNTIPNELPNDPNHKKELNLAFPLDIKKNIDYGYKYILKAPLWQQLVNWFDKKDLHIVVDFPQSISGCIGYITTIDKSIILIDEPGTIWENRNKFYRSAILKAIELCQKIKQN